MPKGYLIERLVGLHCPDGIESVAQGFTDTLENIRDAYRIYVQLGKVPFVPDAGIPSHSVFKRIQPDAFRALHESVTQCARQARTALDAQDIGASAKLWAGIFGIVFPKPPGGGGSNAEASVTSAGFTHPSRSATPGKTEFA